MQNACPHCGAVIVNLSDDANFCESCGKALPAMFASGPRIVGKSEMAATDVGKELQASELQKQAKKAAGALLAVAIIQIVVGTILLLVAKGNNVPVAPIDYAYVYGLGVLFFVLFFWARINPLPPAIIGLVIYVSAWISNIAMNPETFYHGIVVKVIIVVGLIQAISAGVKYNQVIKNIGGTNRRPAEEDWS